MRDWSEVKKALHDGFAATDSYMLEAIAEIEQLRQDIATLVAEHRNARDSLAASDRENGRLRQEKAELQSQVDALSDTVNMYVTPYYELKAEKAELVEALDNLISAVENGIECFEEPDTPAGYLGNAVSPESDDVQTATDLLKRLNPKLEGGETHAKP